MERKRFPPPSRCVHIFVHMAHAITHRTIVFASIDDDCFLSSGVFLLFWRIFFLFSSCGCAFLYFIFRTQCTPTIHDGRQFDTVQVLLPSSVLVSVSRVNSIPPEICLMYDFPFFVSRWQSRSMRCDAHWAQEESVRWFPFLSFHFSFSGPLGTFRCFVRFTQKRWTDFYNTPHIAGIAKIESNDGPPLHGRNITHVLVVGVALPLLRESNFRRNCFPYITLGRIRAL